MNLKFLQETGKKNLLLKDTKKPHILRIHPNFQVFFLIFFKLFWVIFHIVIIHGHYMNLKFFQETGKKITSQKY